MEYDEKKIRKTTNKFATTGSSIHTSNGIVRNSSGFN